MRIGHVAPLTGVLALGALAAGLSSALADRLGRRVGEGLASGIAIVIPPPPAVPPRFELLPDHVPGAPPRLELLPEHAAAAPRRSVAPAASDRGTTADSGRRSSRAAAGGAPPARRGLRVPATAVLRLARSGARPRGVPVPAEGPRPAGILLQGVGGLGVGLQDGDVLTMAGGAPALAPSDVVGMVIAARGRRAALIGGQFWRDGEPWNLVVEQPYPAPADGADDRDGDRLTTAPIAAK